MRADSGVVGLVRNSRQEQRISKNLQVAHVGHLRIGRLARVFADFRWSTLDSWSRHRRVVAKAEHLPTGSNPGFAVTLLARRDVPARSS